MQSNEKYLFFFSKDFVEGDYTQKEILGGKGAGLARMCQLGVPVPSGFTIGTSICEFFYQNQHRFPSDFNSSVVDYMKKLEKDTQKVFGGKENPLLVSVRSGAAMSMPGMMDTILNLGLNWDTLEALIRKTQKPRFAYDSYRRFIQMFGEVVKGIPHHQFESILDQLKKEKNYTSDRDLSEEDMKYLTQEYLKKYEAIIQKPFPQDVWEQLWDAINAVILSWQNERAVQYRQIHDIKHLKGTAINICSMVFGNINDRSGTGVFFTRNPSTGSPEIYGEFLNNAQGEDIVAGIRTPMPLIEIKKYIPNLYEEIEQIGRLLEKHNKDMQDIEFTVEDGKLYLLQTRNGKRNALADIRIAYDLVQEGILTPEQALLNINPKSIANYLLPYVDKHHPDFAKIPVIASGLGASNGVGIGKVTFDPKKIELKSSEESYILFAEETSPEYVIAMYKSSGIVTTKGGATSHAAVVARAMGKPCIVGCSDLQIAPDKKSFTTPSGQVVKEGDTVSIDGLHGQIYLQAVPLTKPSLESKEYHFFINLAKMTKKVQVRVNADTPEDCQQALYLGAEGVGLARTEHMFFQKDRILTVRQMILASSKEERKMYLDKLLPYQKDDFRKMLQVMQDYPVTIRLLDPPLHEFLPKDSHEIENLAYTMNTPKEELEARIASITETNPMLGFRGCRLGIVHPEIYTMQVQAIIDSACEIYQETHKIVQLEIMIPLVSHIHEIQFLRKMIEATLKERLKFYGNPPIPYLIGSMIETPRAALTSSEIATQADFFSYGTNDLTQMCFGFSRDDVSTFLDAYKTLGIIEKDPFIHNDEAGVGRLIHISSQEARAINPNIKLGVCGDQGGDPSSIRFFISQGVNYVSCSTFSIPTAMITAAQEEIKNKKS